MGLIKTGLALAGTYGLIKAASKAANEHEEKKQQRHNQPQYPPPSQYHPGYNPQTGYVHGNHMNQHPAAQPQWRSPYPYEAPPNYESHVYHASPHQQANASAEPQRHYPNSKN
ncbi:uncharacterized protein N7459_002780 [Penicillium hispanicum]|uniref:uncharacterized protein n=1 Tax=Penicillium hispanicum TaxID=1080232 RepID=UPI0025414C1C|nr:uncharacterized protein N7459_002780 [Penicillium hispanicum]KAJ5587015.1 hypothetical protein N7459_002780 [Penicillium hispanicum]